MHSGQAQVLSDPQAIRQWMLDFIHSCSLSSEHLPAILQQIPLYQVSMNIGCVACLPLHSGAAAAGVWVLTAGQAFSPADLERLQKLGLQLAEVIFHVQTQDALQASEEQFRRLSAEMEQRVLQRTAEVRDLYENAPAGYHSLDTAGCLVTINQTELDWLGYSRPEVIGRPILELFPAQQGGLPAKFSGISEKRPA
jgi:PAS domain-containing protein